jgi:hypothetical protein
MFEVLRCPDTRRADPLRRGISIMKKKIAAIAMCGCMVTGSVVAQAPSAGRPPAAGMPAAPSASPSTSMSAPNGASTAPSGPASPYSGTGSTLPGPIKDDDIRPIAIALPDDPLEQYLITKENGPFMVLAQVFRGPDSERMALALCKELREEFHLPAYIMRTKEFPMKSYIRGTPVQAPSETTKSAIKQPEQIRIHDEAAVLVGNEKTLEGSEHLLKEVKKLHPKCLDGMPKLWPWRGAGLSRAIRTTNPYVPAQWLFPKTRDELVVQMNWGSKSIAHCPGRYTLQVASFSGRSAFDLTGQRDPMMAAKIDPTTSPLKSAKEDAERLADQLARRPEFTRLRQPVYVYHDRTSSRVFVGSFNSANEAKVIHDELLKTAGALNIKNAKDSRRSLDTMIIPASQLTAVDDLKATLR